MSSLLIESTMNMDIQFSMIFPSIDDFVLALQEFDARGYRIEDFSIEGPPCLLIRNVHHADQFGSLVVKASDATSTEELFGEKITQVASKEFGLHAKTTGLSISAIWATLKAKYPFLKHTELFLRNPHNFTAAFVTRNQHWFVKDNQ